MFLRRSRSIQLIAAAAVALIALTACGGSSKSNNTNGPSGPPVRGGTLTIEEGTEPRSLDPQIMGNSNPQETALGNGLYGALFINDPKTNTFKPSIGQSIETTDDGTTWTVKLKPNIVYSDGTPMTAADIKYNWEHAADPATASSYIGDAKTMKSITVVDDLALTVVLIRPNILFPALIWEASLNWIGKPAVIQQGQAAVNAHPIGAGPFTLKEWRRQDAIELVRNDKYWDAPKPYLDAINIRALNDPTQRYNTLTSGGADIDVESDWQSLDKATKAGLQTQTIQSAGGVGLAFNTTRAPFDDVRARQAVSKALDLDTIADAASNGKGPVPDTLFYQDQPYYQNIPLHKKDTADAQKLFDQLAAEGKPLSFTVTTLSPATKPLADSVQTQLSAFKNVKVSIQSVDFAQYGTVIVRQRNFDMLPSSISTNRIWRALSSESQSNITKIDDPQMTAALDTTQVKSTDAQLQAAYKTVQERMVATVPYILYTRQALGVIANKNVGGLSMYGYGSLQVENLWKSN